MKNFMYNAIFVAIGLAAIIAVIKLASFMFSPEPASIGFEYVENDQRTCWRFKDERGRGPGDWNRKEKK